MKRILEIGGGRTPYFIRYKIPWNLEDNYTVIDLDEKNLAMTKEAMEKHAVDGNICPINPFFTLADASHLDMLSCDVDEVVISNTLSAPIHHDWDRNGYTLKKSNKSVNLDRIIRKAEDLEDPFYLERKKLLDEALRVLKVGGTLSIYTDLVIYGLHSYNRLLEELKNADSLRYKSDMQEALRIDLLNIQKLASNEFCCCFRAEILPESKVYRFVKI